MARVRLARLLMLTPYPAHPLTPYPPLIINAALTGIVSQRERVPRLPVTCAQIADDADACWQAGATIVHLHVRDADGNPAWRRGAYAELIVEIRRRCPEIVICATTSGRLVSDLACRADVLLLDGDARPDLASLTLGSINFATGASINEIAAIEDLAARMLSAGVVPELEIFDLGMAHLAHRLQARGLLPTALYANLMLGFANGAAADARSLVALVDALPPQTTWSVGGFGAYQQVTNALAIAAGGHARTGLEDNPYLDHRDRTPAANEELVARAAAQAAAVGRPVATCAQARALLGLAAVRATVAAG